MKHRQVTSLGAERGRDDALTDKYVVLQPGVPRQILDVRGPGRVVRLWFTLPFPGRALRDVTCRMYWDGEEEPSVLCPLGDLFGAAFGRGRWLVSDRLVIAGGGWLCRFEMPFTSRAVIELVNEGERPVSRLFYQVAWVEEPERTASLPTFHACWRRSAHPAGGPPHLLLEAQGRGSLAGVKVDLQGLGWWLRPPWAALVVPRGLGLGVLEGWEAIEVDGEPALTGTGGEDYFLGGLYFRGGAFCTPTHGATVRSFATARVSAYRLHVDDLIPFTRSLRVTLDHGWRNTMAGDCCSVVWWYQEEPHAPLPALPPPSGRRPRAPWLQLVQLALLAAPLVALLAWAWTR